MVKKMPFLVVVVCSVMMFLTNANASFLATLIDGGILLSNKIAGLLQKEAKEKLTAVTIKPTPEEIENAMSSLSQACQDISSKGIPCAYSEAMGCTRASALKIAGTRSIQALAESMNSYVTGETIDSLIQSVEGGGIEIEKQEFVSGFKSTVNAQVNNSQVFLSYESKRKPYEGEACKGDVYLITTVRVLNAELFGEAAVETSLGEKISKRIIEESMKGIANKVTNSLKKK